jgi:molybdopterin synthase sulfur carrier subunit
VTRILFLGKLRDAAGEGERTHALPPSVRTTDDLIAWLAVNNAALREALSEPSVKIVADHEIVARNAVIQGAREVAFLPPVSGG